MFPGLDIIFLSRRGLLNFKRGGGGWLEDVSGPGYYFSVTTRSFDWYILQYVI